MMTRSQIEKKLAEYLDDRYWVMQVVKLNKDAYQSNRLVYDGACAAILQIGSVERNNNGKHYLELD